MIRRHAHWIEKFQVQLTAVAAGVATYFLIWGLVSPTDPDGPVTFVATGSLGRAGLLAVAACAMAAVCCLTTVSVRPEGTLAAVLLGLGGLSLRSGPMRALLWARQQDMAAMYRQMAVEVFLLAAVLVAVGLVVSVVRRAAAPLAGSWAWADILKGMTDEQRRAYLKSVGAVPEKGKQAAPTALTGGGFAAILIEDSALAADRREGRRLPGGEVLVRYALCLVLCGGIMALVVWVLAQSADRGQVLFALLGGGFLGALIAYQIVPTRCSIPACAAPIAVAAAYYVLAVTRATQTGQGAWMEMIQPDYYWGLALPIDWLTAGVGGAVLGYWVSSRMHEAKFIEHLEEQEEGA